MRRELCRRFCFRLANSFADNCGASRRVRHDWRRRESCTLSCSFCDSRGTRQTSQVERKGSKWQDEQRRLEDEGNFWKRPARFAEKCFRGKSGEDVLSARQGKAGLSRDSNQWRAASQEGKKNRSEGKRALHVRNENETRVRRRQGTERKSLALAK